MKTYSQAVVMVAMNDNPGDEKFLSVRSSVSTNLIADIYEYPVGQVAKDIIAVRKQIRVNTGVDNAIRGR
jgi:hypothetical protein